MAMLVVDSARAGCKLYEYDYYLYRKNKTRGETTYYKCREECGVTAKVVNGELTIRGEHDHAPNLEEIQLLQMIHKLRAAASSPIEKHKSLRTIFDEVSEEFPHVADRIGFPEVYSLMYRERKKNKPDPPANIEEIGRLLGPDGRWRELGLSKGPNDQPFFRAVVGPPEEQSAVFVSPGLLTMLGASSTIHMNGTFESLPLGIGGARLFTLHGTHLNYAFPVVYAVMERRTTTAYEAVLRLVRELCPLLQPVSVLADYEPALRDAAALVWPGVNFTGCWFHYSQAVWKKHKRIGLYRLTETNEMAGKVLKMMMCLPLLPAANILEGFRTVREMAQANNLMARFRPMFRYFQDYWLDTVGCAAISVYRLPHRTNNAVESFCWQLNEIVGRHPGFWDFLERIKTLEWSQTTDYWSLDNGVCHVRPRRRAVRRRSSNIAEAQEYLSTGRYTIGQFLERVSHSVDGLDRFLRDLLQPRPRGRRQRQQPKAAEGAAPANEEEVDNPEPLGPVVANQPHPPAQEPPAQEPPAQEPQAQEPSAQEPQAQEPPAQEPQAQEPQAQEPQAQEPQAQEPPAQEPPAQEPQAQEPPAQEPPAQEPQAQEPPAQEPQAQEPQAQEPQIHQPVGNGDVEGNNSSEEEADIRGTCVVCRRRAASFVVAPCGHICLCQTCADELPRHVTPINLLRCPMCRGDAILIFKTYMAP